MHQVEDGRILVHLSHYLIIYTTYRSVYNDERSKLLVAYDAFGGWRFADRLAVGSKTFVVAYYHNHHILVVRATLQIVEEDAQSVVGIVGHNHEVAHLIWIISFKMYALQVVGQDEWVMTGVSDYLQIVTFSFFHDFSFLEFCHNLLHERYVAQFLAAAHFLVVNPLIIEKHLVDTEVFCHDRLIPGDRLIYRHQIGTQVGMLFLQCLDQ